MFCFKKDRYKKMAKVPFEYRISAIYIVLGALWILFSDKFMLSLTSEKEQILLISTYKGWFYVLITGILLFLLIKKEIKARNEVYNKLVIANKKAIESERLKSAFLSNISHYMRTPMNSILGFVELLENQNLDENKRSLFMSVINDQSQYLLQLLNNIIDVSKLQEGQMEISRDQFSINEMCLRILSYLEQELSKKKSAQTIEFKPVLPEDKEIIIADQQKIHSVFINLIQNAIKHSKSTKIEFGYTLSENTIIFYVKDNGVGIPKERLDYFFEGNMFTTSSFEGANEGIGLGLYLSHRLVQMLGGRLWVDYSNQKGTKICFNILYKPDNTY